MTLNNFQTSNGFFSIAAFDHRSSLAKSLGLDLSLEADQVKFLSLKQLFMKHLSPHVSAVLTDPNVGITTLDLKSPQAGLFLSLEESSYGDDPDALTTLKENWGIDGVKSHGAGAKLLVYFNPHGATAQAKVEMTKKLYEEAKSKGVVLLVEPVLYDLKTEKQWETVGDENWITTHLEVCNTFAPLCDILKIQYPGSDAACAQVSTLHNNWILLSRGAEFSIFKQNLTVALHAGAKGYAAGRAVWQELTSMHSVPEWETFLQTTAVERLQDLNTLLG